MGRENDLVKYTNPVSHPEALPATLNSQLLFITIYYFISATNINKFVKCRDTCKHEIFH